MLGLITHERRIDEVMERMAAHYRELVSGPALSDLDLCPLVSHRQKNIVGGYLQQGYDLETLAQGSIHPDVPGGGTLRD